MPRQSVVASVARGWTRPCRRRGSKITPAIRAAIDAERDDWPKKTVLRTFELVVGL